MASRGSFIAKPVPGAARSLKPLLLVVCLLLQPLAGTAAAQTTRRSRRATAAPAAMPEQERIAHVLARLTFGARPGDYERVQAMGIDTFIEEQLDPLSIDDAALDARLAKLGTLSLPTPALAEAFNPKPALSPSPKPSPSPAQSGPAMAGTTAAMPAMPSTSKPAPSPATAAMVQAMPPAGQAVMPKPAASPVVKPTPPPRNPGIVVGQLQQAAVLRAVYSNRQLYEMMVDFWENHFSIFGNKDADRLMLTSFDRDTVRPYAFGRFRDLLGATAMSPAMLFYLDNWQSSVVRHYPAANGKPERTTGGINENYARELMELHTLGVDGGYTQKDVQEVARCFTGWTIRKPNEEGLFIFFPAAHDQGEKIVLGHRIPAGGGISDALAVLDILARHPSTARFIATKLARRFIGDDPPKSVVDRAAQVFLQTDGSVRDTLKSIITSPEFFSTEAFRSKTRSPFEYAVAAARALGAETDGDRPFINSISRMGQVIFGRITPDGYPDRADAWLSTGNLLERLNFASALANNRIPGTRIAPARLLGDAGPPGDPRAAALALMHIAMSDVVRPPTREALDRLASDTAAKMAALPAVAAQQPGMSPGMNVTFSPAAASQFKPGGGNPQIPPYLSGLITLAIGSPEFQRR